jgi:hypothetical protein
MAMEATAPADSTKGVGLRIAVPSVRPILPRAGNLLMLLQPMMEI